MSKAISFFWFRRDLRLHDNTALFHALSSENQVQAVFIFDTDILDKLEEKSDRRLVFIHEQLKQINEKLKAQGATLLVEQGKPIEVWKKLTENFSIKDVYVNRDYEPYALERDKLVTEFLSEQNIKLNLYKDQVIFEKAEVSKEDGSPYIVFTPYSKRWKAQVNKNSFKTIASEKLLDNFHKHISEGIPSLKEIGFNDLSSDFPEKKLDNLILNNYETKRDLPAVNGTSKLSVHLRFGTLSIRELFRQAWSISEKWINELIWREFYMSILWNFPHVVDRAFKPAYDRLEWLHDEEGFQAWCSGKTGYPIVDAGIRELNETGFMHNRVRMITATFLCKYLLIDWRWGEAYFAKKLLDFDLSANNGGWQWCAGTGVDAAPYFRIFSMDSQTQRFDPKLEYIRRWIPEFGTEAYPKPIIDYGFARKRCLSFYKQGLAKE